MEDGEVLCDYEESLLEAECRKVKEVLQNNCRRRAEYFCCADLFVFCLNQAVKQMPTATQKGLEALENMMAGLFLKTTKYLNVALNLFHNILTKPQQNLFSTDA
ncbi:hypothetical protein ILYODFUR_021823 [Ilyodon furcidens]|uniref:Interleukin-6 n=1 Tax=Ilyodon furcidens TaxID=33524 RepID=A0ABV0TLR1_9TELE